MHQANRWFCSLCALSSSCALTAGFVATPALMAAGRGSARKIGDHHRGRIFRAVDGESAEIDWDKEWKAKLAELKKNEEQEDGASQPEIPRDQQQFESIKEVLDKEEEEEEYSDRIPVAFSKRKEIIVDRDGDEYIYREVDFRGREEGSGFLLEGETVTSKAQQDGLFLGNLGGQNQLQNGFLLGAAGILGTVIFYIYVFLSGGIADADTRFAGMEMPTYDSGPILPPTPDDDFYLSISDESTS